MFKKLTFVLFTLCLVGGLSTVAMAAVSLNEAAPDFTLTDSNGQEHSLSDFAGKYVILEWVNYDCPFVVKHYSSGNMQGLQKKMTDKDIVWLSINSSAPGKQGNFTSQEINQKIEERDASPTAYLIDESGDVGRLYGAKTTPHMYIINPEGELVYQGAIDSIPSFDTNDIAKADNYVLKALDEVMAGQSVSMAATKSYGCSVKY